MRGAVWVIFLFAVVCGGVCDFFLSTSRAESLCDDGLRRVKEMTSLLEKKEALKDLVGRCKDHAEVNYQCAYTLERLRKYEEAARYYERATRLDPKNPRYFFGLGDVYRVLGEVDKAKRAYETGLAIAPGNRRAERCLRELEQMAIRVKDAKMERVERGAGSVKGTVEAVEEPPAKRAQVALNISKPYVGDPDFSRRLRRLIHSLSRDKRIKDVSTREFSRRKALDEQYFIKGEKSTSD